MIALPCASICLLSFSLLNFRPSPDIRKCTYCVQLRGLGPECRKKPRSCAAWDSDSLLYCLVRNEHPWGRELLHSSMRCISHADLSSHRPSLLPALALLTDDHLCTVDSVQRKCHCSDCPSSGSDLAPIEDTNFSVEENEKHRKDGLLKEGWKNGRSDEEDRTEMTITQMEGKIGSSKSSSRKPTTPRDEWEEEEEDGEGANKNATETALVPPADAFPSPSSAPLAPIGVTFRSRNARRPMRSQRKLPRKCPPTADGSALFLAHSAECLSHSAEMIHLPSQTILMALALLIVVF